MTITSPRRRGARARALVLSGLSGLGAATVGGVAHAQDYRDGLEDQQPVRIGDAELFPSLRVDYLFNDNAGLRSENEVDATAVVASPQLAFVADRAQLGLRLAYDGEYSQGSEPPLDYNDHRLGLDVDAAFGARQRASLAVYLARQHLDVGTEFTRGVTGVTDEPVGYNDSGAELDFTYGARDARGNLVVGLRLRDLSYTSRPSLTDGRSYTAIEPFGQFTYRLSGDTRAVLELGYATFDFDGDAGDDDDRDELNVRVGALFAATGRVRGNFLVGVSNASYAETGIEDESAFTTRADIDYLLREYSRFRFTLARDFDNLSPTSGTPGEDQSIRTLGRLAWTHRWSERFSTQAFGALVDVARTCPDRPTTTVAAGIEGDLAIRRWLQVGASAGLSSRTADECDVATDEDLDYDQGVYGVHVRATL